MTFSFPLWMIITATEEVRDQSAHAQGARASHRWRTPKMLRCVEQILHGWLHGSLLSLAPSPPDHHGSSAVLLDHLSALLTPHGEAQGKGRGSQ